MTSPADALKPADFLRERYWARKRPAISCRAALRARKHGGGGDWDVAVHLRLGDLIAPAVGTGDASRDGRSDNWAERAANTAKGMATILRSLCRLKAAMKAASAEHRFVSLVVSDTPFDVVRGFLKRHAGIQIWETHADHDEYASYTIAKAVLDSGDSMELSFMSATANPLVSMHCLAAADALVLPFHAGDELGPSSFALMAANLGRGSVIQTAEVRKQQSLTLTLTRALTRNPKPRLWSTLTLTLTQTLTLTLAQTHTATINPNPNETPQELDERIARIQGDGADAWADSFVQNFLSPKGNFASEREKGAYPPTKLPTRSDPL